VRHHGLPELRRTDRDRPVDEEPRSLSTAVERQLALEQAVVEPRVARWPGDAHRFANDLLRMLGEAR
jgi:hypothetical protein